MRQSQPGAPGNKRLRNLKYKWTYPPGATGNETEQTLAAVILPDTDGSPTGESAIGAIRQVLHLMLRSLDELDEHQLEQARR
jgi:hypothetical protein